jgi:hypothetical protein
VNREIAEVKNYSPLPLSGGAMPFSLSQTGSGTSGLTCIVARVRFLAGSGTEYVAACTQMEIDHRLPPRHRVVSYVHRPCMPTYSLRKKKQVHQILACSD